MKKLTFLWQTLESTLDLKGIEEHWRSCLKDEYEVVRACFVNTHEIATCFIPPGQNEQFAIAEFDGKYYATHPDTNEIEREFKKSELNVRVFDIERFGRLLLPSLGWSGPPSKPLGVKRYCQLGRLPIEHGGHPCFLAIPAHPSGLCEILDDISMRVNHRRYLVLVPTPGRQNQRVDSVLERTQGHLFTCDEIFCLNAVGKLAATHSKLHAIGEFFGVQPSRNIFRRNGKGDWTISFEGVSNAITHAKGFPYIAFLLARPGVAINVQDLEEIVSGFKAAYTKGESVPFTTIESLEKLDDRLVGAKDELTIATRNNDLATIGVLQKEINWIEEEKNRCKGLGKRIRSESELETLRKRITKRINDGIEKIRKQNARFADYLHCHIDRGLILKYNTTESVDWITEA